VSFPLVHYLNIQSRCHDTTTVVSWTPSWILQKAQGICARVTSLGFWLRGSRWPRNRWKTSDVPKCTVHHWNALRGISSMEGYSLYWSGRYTW